MPNKGAYKKGEKRPNQGRPKGLKNKVTRDIAEAFQKYGGHCVEGLYKLSMHKQPAIRLAAINSMLAYGYGRPKQVAETQVIGGITVHIETLSGHMPDAKVIELPKLTNGHSDGNGYSSSE